MKPKDTKMALFKSGSEIGSDAICLEGLSYFSHVQHHSSHSFMRGCSAWHYSAHANSRCFIPWLSLILFRWTREFRVDGIPHIAFVLPDRQDMAGMRWLRHPQAWRMTHIKYNQSKWDKEHHESSRRSRKFGMHLNAFECIWMHLSAFECIIIYNAFECTWYFKTF